MSLFLVSYDLRKRGRDYQQLYDGIARHRVIARPLESVVVIESPNDAVTLHNDLQRYIDGNDGLLVLKLAGPGAWVGINNSDSLLNALNAQIARA